jgi:hypothetical protein
MSASKRQFVEWVLPCLESSELEYAVYTPTDKKPAIFTTTKGKMPPSLFRHLALYMMLFLSSFTTIYFQLLTPLTYQAR